MAKTIKEIAEEIGVSKQAVFKKIKQEPLSMEIGNFISTVDGKILVSDGGEKLIKQAFRRKQKAADLNIGAKIDGKKVAIGSNAGNTVDNIPSVGQEQENMLAAALQTAIDALTSQLEAKDRQLEAKDQQLEEKDRQLAEKDKQLDRQARTIEELSTSLAVAHHTAQAAQALHAGTLQRQIEDAPIMQAEEMKVATETEEELMPEHEKKRGIFSRIFGGR